MPTFNELAAQAEQVFGFVSQLGFRQIEREIFWPASFKGGFVIVFESASSSLSVEYSELALLVKVGNSEVFGPSVHPSFAGNMFSAEHLAEHLPQIAERVREALAEGSSGAA
jgi:hypothetical protein